MEVDSDTLSVTEKSSSGVVSGGSGNVQIEGRSGSVVVANSYVRGNIFNRVNGGTGGIVIINGEQTGSSQPEARRETQVVLKVPVAENANNEGKKPKPKYIIEVDFGNIKFENVTGEYDISLNTGNIEVTDGIFISENTGENTVKTEAGDILVKFDRDQGEIEVKASVGGRVIQKLYFEGVENPNGQTAILRLTAKAGKIEVNE